MRVGVIEARWGRVVGGLPVGAIVLAALLFASPDAALAACDPAAASNVTATCTGTTVDQGPSAGIGYGDPFITNLNVTVVPGATVTGTSNGMVLLTGTVTNFGTITGLGGGNSGIGGLITSNFKVINFGTVTGGLSGAGISGGIVDVTNSRTIVGGNYGIQANTGTVTNSGTVWGGLYGIAAPIANVTNSGTVWGGDKGINATLANVTNSGNLSGGNVGILATIANVTNSGTISGALNGIATTTGTVTNSGTIIGGSGTAILFGSGLPETLTVLPGARFGGLVDFGGGADTVNFGPGNWILYTANFNAALSTITTGGNPYWVTPNSIVVANMSSFGAINRAMPDITNWISSVLPDSPVFEPVTNAAANAFAAIQQVSPRVEEAFAQFPGGALSYAPNTPVFKGGAVSDGAGNAFWAKGFAGRREQDTVGNFIGALTKGYGGAIGYDHKFNPAFQIGGFVGMSNNTTTMNLNLGSTDIDTAFGGVYARTLLGPAFLDLSFIGGQLDNQSKRNIGGGLNLETATANYGGWFVNPAAALGYRYALGNGLTLTPAIKVRYLKSSFDSYAETGSSANLTVAGWDSAVFEERAELSLASVQYFGGDQRILFRMTGGAIAQQRQGDSNIGLTFAGQSLFALAPDQRRVNGWYGSAGFDWQRGAFAIFAAGEITDTSDSAVSYSGKGGVRVVW